MEKFERWRKNDRRNLRACLKICRKGIASAVGRPARSEERAYSKKICNRRATKPAVRPRRKTDWNTFQTRSERTKGRPWFADLIQLGTLELATNCAGRSLTGTFAPPARVFAMFEFGLHDA